MGTTRSDGGSAPYDISTTAGQVSEPVVTSNTTTTLVSTGGGAPVEVTKTTNSMGKEYRQG